ncbi:MAG TPA: SLC13 family permease, partial [bacterium]|nr:SLC13 family permease [bacterium]
MGPALNFYLSIFIFLIAYIFIISEKINRMIVALLGATIMIFVKILFSDKALELIDWNVILLLIGMMLIVNMIKKIGIFEWLAIKTAKLVKGNPVYLMILLMWITAIISAFLDNVTTVLLIAPVILLLSAQMK